MVLGSGNGALTGTEPWPLGLVAEAMAQAILAVGKRRSGVEPRLIGLDEVRVLQPLVAGDRLEVEVVEIGSFGSLRRYRCRGMCAGALAATAAVTVSG